MKTYIILVFFLLSMHTVIAQDEKSPVNEIIERTLQETNKKAPCICKISQNEAKIARLEAQVDILAKMVKSYEKERDNTFELVEKGKFKKLEDKFFCTDQDYTVQRKRRIWADTTYVVTVEDCNGAIIQKKDIPLYPTDYRLEILNTPARVKITGIFNHKGGYSVSSHNAAWQQNRISIEFTNTDGKKILNKHNVSLWQNPFDFQVNEKGQLLIMGQ